MEWLLPLADIVSVKSEGKRLVCVAFDVGEGEIRTLRLWLKKPMAFMATIEDGRRRGGDLRDEVLDSREG